MICLFEESHCSPALLKVPIYSAELVAVIFVYLYLIVVIYKSAVLNARK